MAWLLLAKALDEKVYFLRERGAQEDEVREWEVRRDQLRGDCPIKYIRQLSVRRLAKGHSPSLGSWYVGVYKLACEPAHIGDLLEFMPDRDAEIRVGPSPASRLRAVSAIHYGAHIVVRMFEAINDTNDAGLRVPIEELQAQLEAIVTPDGGPPMMTG